MPGSRECLAQVAVLRRRREIAPAERSWQKNGCTSGWIIATRRAWVTAIIVSADALMESERYQGSRCSGGSPAGLDHLGAGLNPTDVPYRRRSGGIGICLAISKRRNRSPCPLDRVNRSQHRSRVREGRDWDTCRCPPMGERRAEAERAPGREGFRYVDTFDTFDTLGGPFRQPTDISGFRQELRTPHGATLFDTFDTLSS
jgi:hypothetical protein